MNNRYLKPYRNTSLALLFCISSSVFAHDACLGESDSYEESLFTFGIGLSAANSSFDFEQDIALSHLTAENGFLDFESSGNANVLGLNLSVGVSDVYLNFVVESTVGGSLEADNSQGVGNDTAGHVSYSTESDFEQRGLYATLGWHINDYFTAFGGYQAVNNSFEDEPKTFTSDVLANLEYTDYSFKSNGPFIGASTQFHFGDVGAISLSASYAFLNGRMKHKHISPISLESGTEYWAESYKLEGESTGLSFAVSWDSMITESFGYHVKWKYHNYEYDMDDSLDVHLNPTVIVGDDEDSLQSSNVTTYDLAGTVKESISSFSAGISLYF